MYSAETLVAPPAGRHLKSRSFSLHESIKRERPFSIYKTPILRQPGLRINLGERRFVETFDYNNYFLFYTFAENTIVPEKGKKKNGVK